MRVSKFSALPLRQSVYCTVWRTQQSACYKCFIALVVKRLLQLRFDFESTAVRRALDVHSTAYERSLKFTDVL